MKYSAGLLSSVLVLVCGLIGSIALSTPAHAAGEAGPFIEAGIRLQAMKFSAQQLMLGCINTGNLDDLSGGRTRDTIAIGSWMNNRNTLMHIGYFDDPDDGTFGCAPGGRTETTAGIENRLLGVIGTLGWTDSIEAYCAFGAVGKDGQPCGQGTYGFDKPPTYDAAKAAITSKNNGNLYTLSDAARYTADWKALSIACKLSDGIEVESLTNSGTRKGGGAIPVAGRMAIRVINIDASESIVSFKYERKSGPIHAFALNSHNGAGIGFSDCQAVANDLNRNAGAYATYMSFLLKTQPNPDGETGNGSNDPANTSSCAISGGIGWFICPAAGGIASFVATAFTFMANLMEIRIFGQTDSKLLTIWENMRNIANVIFVALFLLIIYSQIVGGGKR